MVLWKFQTKKFVSNDGGSPSSDQMVPKKETRLKLTILKKDRHHDHEQVKLMKRKTMIKKTSANQYNIIVNETGYNGSNNCVIRICSDCNTTKTPLWRSGPRGPKVTNHTYTS